MVEQTNAAVLGIYLLKEIKDVVYNFQIQQIIWQIVWGIKLNDNACQNFEIHGSKVIEHYSPLDYI